MLATDPKVQKDDLLPIAIDGGSWNGNLYAFLIGFIPGPVSLYYNVDHFTKAGIAASLSRTGSGMIMRNAAQELTKLQARRHARDPGGWFRSVVRAVALLDVVQR